MPVIVTVGPVMADPNNRLYERKISITGQRVFNVDRVTEFFQMMWQRYGKDVLHDLEQEAEHEH